MTATKSNDSPLITRPVWQTKWLLPSAAFLAYAACWWLAGRVGASRVYGFDGSLLATGKVWSNLVIALIAVLAGGAIGTILAGSVRPDAGMCAAGFALLALGNRGRSTVSVLQDVNGNRSIYLLFALELVLLSIFMAACWWVLHRMQHHGHLHRDPARDGLADADLPANAGWQELIRQIVVTAAVILIMAQSEDRKQLIAAVGIGAFAGAFFPYWQHGARPSVWYWTGPLIVGLIGYLFAFISPPQGFELGRPDLNGGGILGALSRPLPLDYASMGPAGALLGYWMRRKSLKEREMQTQGVQGSTH
jgi:hypothetical protein